MVQGIIVQYFKWHFYEMPNEILTGWRNFIVFGLNYFSLPVLLRTIFSPWHKYSYDYGKQFNIGRWFEAFTFNMMSRGIGAILRIFIIAVGLFAEVFIFIGGAMVFLVWLLLPLVIAASFFGGLVFLFP